MDPEAWDELTRFVNWLYEEGPDPDAVPRAKLLAAYLAWRESAGVPVADTAT